jgi:hypothetical protein
LRENQLIVRVKPDANESLRVPPIGGTWQSPDLKSGIAASGASICPDMLLRVSNSPFSDHEGQIAGKTIVNTFETWGLPRRSFVAPRNDTSRLAHVLPLAAVLLPNNLPCNQGYPQNVPIIIRNIV